MADIPAPLGGAAPGNGLDSSSLRHVRRTKVLVHVLDASGGLEGREPLQDFETVNAELNATKKISSPNRCSSRQQGRYP